MDDSKAIKIDYDEYSGLRFTENLIMAFIAGLTVFVGCLLGLEFGVALATFLIILCILDVRFGLIMMKHHIKNLECYKKKK